MATVSDTLPPVQGLTNGILMPKLIHQFRVHFTTDRGDEIPSAIDLTGQIVSVGDFVLETTNHLISFVFEDDQLNAGQRALAVLRNTNDFNMLIDILDGSDKKLERRCFTGCRVENVYFSELNYNPNNKGDRFVVDFPKQKDSGFVKEMSPEFEALMLALSGASVTFIDHYNETSNSVLHHTVEIAYSKFVQTLYPE